MCIYTGVIFALGAAMFLSLTIWPISTIRRKTAGIIGGILFVLSLLFAVVGPELIP